MSDSVAIDPVELHGGLQKIFALYRVIEIRLVDVKGKYGKPAIYSGYFDNADDAVKEIKRIEAIGPAKGIYWTINKLHDDMLSVRANRLDVAEKDGTTKDKHIARRAILMVDCDPVRIHSEIASNEEERLQSERLATIIADALMDEGWPLPCMVMSGNGCQLWYRVDLAGDDGGLVERTIKAIHSRFSTPEVKVDTGVFNAARVTKLPGTVARKGDNTANRPHRVARIISTIDSLAELETVPTVAIEAMAATAPLDPPKDGGSSSKAAIPQAARLDADALKATLDADVVRWGLTITGTSTGTGKDGAPWYQKNCTCVFDPSHTGNDAAISVNLKTGDYGYKCFHDSCKGKNIADVKDKVAPGWREQFKESLKPKLPPIEIIHIADLIRDEPTLRPVLVDGYMRIGEVGNIIAAPKTGKTFAILNFAVGVALGGLWFGARCTQGRVLLVDNELHRPTIAKRLGMVANGNGASIADLQDSIDIVSLRGCLRDIRQLGAFFEAIKSGTYSAVVIDSLYRAIPAGTDENSNSDITAIYNLLDHYAASMNAAILCVHHSSKGWQSEKSVTDVGAGAGAQARAVDMHMALRQHEEDGAIVVDAVTRSFPPPGATCWRVDVPIFKPAEDLDPTALRTAPKRKVKEVEVHEPWTPARLAKQCLNGEPRIIEQVYSIAAGYNLKSKREIDRLLREGVAGGWVTKSGGVKGCPARFAQILHEGEV